MREDTVNMHATIYRSLEASALFWTAAPISNKQNEMIYATGCQPKLCEVQMGRALEQRTLRRLTM